MTTPPRTTPPRTTPVRRNARYTPLAADGPLPWDMIRAIPAIRRSPVDFLTAMVSRYGDAVAFPLPRTPVLLLTDPDAVRRVLVDNARNYGRATLQYRALATVTGQGLLTSDGAHWRTHRRVVQPAFHHSSLDGVAEQALLAARRLRASTTVDAGEVEIAEASARATLEVIGRTLADADLTDVAQHLVDAVGRALELVVGRAQSPVPGSWPTPSRRRLTAAVAEIDAVCAEIVTARRARAVAEDATDLVGLMLRAGFDDAQIRDELVTFVVAGHETVASCLTWTLDLLSRNPSAQDELHAELAAVLGPPGSAREPGWADLARLPRTRAVLDEALRLYPPAWVITRTALGPDTLAGVDVPAGTLVIVCTWALHRRPQTWPDPEAFSPERFLDRPRRDTGYVPFGAGPRLCIGRDLALVEAVLVLASLLRDRRVRPGAGRRPRVESLVTLRPAGGLRLRFETLQP